MFLIKCCPFLNCLQGGVTQTDPLRLSLVTFVKLHLCLQLADNHLPGSPGFLPSGVGWSPCWRPAPRGQAQARQENVFASLPAHERVFKSASLGAVKLQSAPAPCGSVAWVLPPEVKGHWFHPQSVHRPGLQLCSPVGVQPISVSLSH